MKTTLTQIQEEMKKEFPDIFNLPEGGMSVWLEESYTNQMLDFLTQSNLRVIEKVRDIVENASQQPDKEFNPTDDGTYDAGFYAGRNAVRNDLINFLSLIEQK